MSRFSLWSAVGVVSAALVAGCAPPPPADTGSGVGFQDYNSYIRGSSPAPVPTGPVVVPPVGGAFDPAAAAAAIDRAEGVSPVAPVATVTPAPLPPAGQDPARPRGSAPAGIQEESGEMAGNVGISDAPQPMFLLMSPWNSVLKIQQPIQMGMILLLIRLTTR